ncbi:MAG TPA: helix-turn-helix domain-containing protein [Solirubrobacter sp.]
MPRKASTSLPPPPIRRALRQLGEHLGGWRRLRGLTQVQLADRAGVSRETIVRLESGDETGQVKLENALRVLRSLGVLDETVRALDPFASDVGRLRAEEHLPQRVRPRRLTGNGDG